MRIIYRIHDYVKQKQETNRPKDQRAKILVSAIYFYKSEHAENILHFSSYLSKKTVLKCIGGSKFIT